MFSNLKPRARDGSRVDGGPGGGLGQVDNSHHVHVVRDQQGHLQDPRLRRREQEPLGCWETSTACWAVEDFLSQFVQRFIRVVNVDKF